MTRSSNGLRRTGFTVPLGNGHRDARRRIHVPTGPGGTSLFSAAGFATWIGPRFSSGGVGRLGARAGASTTRNPMLLFVLPGSLLFRFAERQLLELLFQLPPRAVASWPRFGPHGGRPAGESIRSTPMCQTSTPANSSIQLFRRPRPQTWCVRASSAVARMANALSQTAPSS